MNAEQLKQLEEDLWSSADTFRANSGLKSNEYSPPILGLIFLKFADNKYRQYLEEITATYEENKDGRASVPLHEIAVAKCGFYLPDDARYDYLLNLPESADIEGALKEAMTRIEEYVPGLKDCLPKDGYAEIAKATGGRGVLNRLLKTFSNIPADVQGDLFGQIYQYFLGKFALAEGQGGGEFFTPPSVVRLMVEVIEPRHGRVFDPACGSAGMFVQSAWFIKERQKQGSTDSIDNIFVCGQEKTAETVKLAKMNLAVNGLRGEIRQGNSYVASESFESLGVFDYVMANPPFNVDGVEMGTVEHDPRFNTYGIPRNKTKPAGKSKTGGSSEGKSEMVPNGNYLWISLFASALKPEGRAALVMANSASDAQHTEAQIRQKLIEKNLISGMLTLPSNMFYTVTLPATLWFFDKGKQTDNILFIDARRVYKQVDRAHREFTDDQVHNLATIVYLNRGQRERFLERVQTCLNTGLVDIATCVTAFKSVKTAIEEALSDAKQKQTLETLMLDPVDDQIRPFTDGIELALLSLSDDLTKNTGETSLPNIEDFRSRIEALNLPFSADISEDTIEKYNREQEDLTVLFSSALRRIVFTIKDLDQAIRGYEKARAIQAEAGGKRAPQDRALRSAKLALDTFTAQVQAVAERVGYAMWLQERFPDARYTDVVGLCKDATQAEVAAQDFSLNPGRYVGVVIEEDGKSAEEFREELREMQRELEGLNAEAGTLAEVISHNISQLVGDVE